MTGVEGHKVREPRDPSGSGTTGPSPGVKPGSVCSSVQTLTLKIPKMGTQTLEAPVAGEAGTEGQSRSRWALCV